jgi:hypothetical protein
MSGVILRCPHCGTSSATAGECTACHEAAVRYMCTNHATGLWLETPACPACGAVFGVAPQPPAPSTPMPPAARRRPEVEHWGRGPSSDYARASDPRAAEMAAAHRRLHDLLRAGIRSRAIPPAEPDESRARGGANLGGCLVRTVALLFVLFLLSTIGPLLFGLSLLQLFRF